MKTDGPVGADDGRPVPAGLVVADGEGVAEERRAVDAESQIESPRAFVVASEEDLLAPADAAGPV